MNDLQTIKAVSSCCGGDRDKVLLNTGSDKSTICTNRLSLRLAHVFSTSASHKPISDLEADDPEQHEGRQEGVQHKKVQSVA